MNGLAVLSRKVARGEIHVFRQVARREEKVCGLENLRALGSSRDHTVHATRSSNPWRVDQWNRSTYTIILPGLSSSESYNLICRDCCSADTVWANSSNPTVQNFGIKNPRRDSNSRSEIGTGGRFSLSMLAQNWKKSVAVRLWFSYIGV